MLRLEKPTETLEMIDSTNPNPDRISILRILNSKGPFTYDELKSQSGFKTKKDSGKFAYHVKKLLTQSLVALNKSKRLYAITNLGKLVLNLAEKIRKSNP